MGANVPLPSLSAAINSTLPDNLLLFLVHFDLPNNTNAYLKDLSTRFVQQNIFVSGNQKMVHQSAPAKNIHWLNSVDDLERPPGVNVYVLFQKYKPSRWLTYLL